MVVIKITCRFGGGVRKSTLGALALWLAFISCNSSLISAINFWNLANCPLTISCRVSIEDQQTKLSTFLASNTLFLSQSDSQSESVSIKKGMSLPQQSDSETTSPFF
jgi:hypothetical protein